MINTVRGPLKREKIGRTLAHEHFKWETDQALAGEMYFARKYNQAYNQTLLAKFLPMLTELVASGCETIVEASPPLGGQNLRLLHELSTSTKVNIIPCTGWNITKYAYDLFPEQFSSQLARRWIKDFEEGLDTIDQICIRPGFIKLLLDRGGVSGVDEAMLRAAAIASNATGMPIHCHVMEAAHIPRVLEILEQMHLPPSKFLWAHADHEGNRQTILSVVERGYWVGFDTIRAGTYQEKYLLIQHAIDNGYSGQITLSQDYDFGEESEREDGTSRYCAFFTRFLPYCQEKGIDTQTLESIIRDNPGRFYDI